MSRIQQVLDKAERDGRMRRTTAVGEGAAAPAAPAEPAPAPSQAPAAPPPSPRVAASPRASAPRPASSAPPALRPVTAGLANPMAAPTRRVDARLSPVLVTAVEPHSAIAEQYRALRTRIAQSEGDKYYRALLVTSAAAGDGKSVTSLNLALAMGQEFHRRVLMVDADLRDPSLHRLVGIPARPGLSDVLLGDATLDDVMVALPDYRITVIPAGSTVDRPTELLGSAEMRGVVDTLRTQFDRIIFDTPPATPLADVGVLAPLVDGVLLVIRAGQTPRPAIDRALEDIDSSRLLGLVLNDVEEAGTDYHYGKDADTKTKPGQPRAGAPRERPRHERAR